VTHTPRAQQRLTFQKFGENFFAIHANHTGGTGEFVSEIDGFGDPTKNEAAKPGLLRKASI
jgi:hypothetical protein